MRESPLLVGFSSNQTVYRRRLPLFNYLRELFGLDAPISEAVMRAHECVTGAAPAVEGVSYGADMRLFIHFGQMPCVMYGAGDVGWAHSADEHIVIDDLLTASKTIACLLVDWCGVAEGSHGIP
jgi:acetylornithine deacetylase/succinyl-diaminopimelate desuccinylase-like protein